MLMWAHYGNKYLIIEGNLIPTAAASHWKGAILLPRTEPSACEGGREPAHLPPEFGFLPFIHVYN